MDPQTDGRYLVPVYEEGGPNDPKVAFRKLRTLLYDVKEELSAWSWRAYCAEFSDRQTAERRLRALHAMPGSGSEEKDGVVKGTPLWQERLDHMLLVEHLKKKIMNAHSKFNDASELFLNSHAWLVKDYHLADTFIKFITTVPESVHDRVDYLQAQLEKCRHDLVNLRHQWEDYIVMLDRQHSEYLRRIMDHQTMRNRLKLLDDVFLSWSYRAQRDQLLDSRRLQGCLEVRVTTLELQHVEQLENFEESERLWRHERAVLVKERDDFKKKWQRMVQAHQQALEDLKRTEGTAEGQRAQILVLSQEKSLLTDKVEELEDHKKRMTKQLADLRDELARLREEGRRQVAQLKETEAVLVDTRLEVERLEGEKQGLEVRLDEAAITEASLREEIGRCLAENDAQAQLVAQARQDFLREQQARLDVEAVRDTFWARIQSLEAELVETVANCERRIEAVAEKAARDLEDFKEKELARVKEEYEKKTDAILIRNDILEREVAIADAETLNPLPVDKSRLCPACGKAFVFEGVYER